MSRQSDGCVAMTEPAGIQGAVCADKGRVDGRRHADTSTRGCANGPGRRWRVWSKLAASCTARFDRPAQSPMQVGPMQQYYLAYSRTQ